MLPGSADKPADVFLPGWATGRDAALDVSVVSPLQQQLVRKAADEAGSAARKRFQEKNAKYYQPCSDEGIAFFPLIVETYRGWHPESEATIKKLSLQLASHTGSDATETTRHLFQKLGILLAKGNAALILRRRIVYSDARVDGDQDF